jgi:hypothetical protein
MLQDWAVWISCISVGIVVAYIYYADKRQKSYRLIRANTMTKKTLRKRLPY